MSAVLCLPSAQDVDLIADALMVASGAAPLPREPRDRDRCFWLAAQITAALAELDDPQPQEVAS